MTLRHSRSTKYLDQYDARFATDDADTPTAILDRISLHETSLRLEPSQNSVYNIEVDREERTILTRTNINIDEDSGSDDDTECDGDVDIGEVFEEIRQTYGEEDASRYSSPEPVDIDLNDIEERIDNIPQETSTEESKTSCANCRIPRRVENVSCLKRGQHIRFPGDHFTFRFRRKLINLYHHHAIVKRVNRTSGNSVELVLIHFSKVDKMITINEATNTYNLEYDEIYMYDYQRPRYDPETIIQRAESMVPKGSDAEKKKQFRSYNLFSCNCEHFASWCVVGEKECFQVKSAVKMSASILSKAAGEGCKIGRFAARFVYNATDEIAAGFNATKHLPFTLLGATAFLYLIYAIAMTILYRIKYSKGKLCKVCFKREVIGLWIGFGAFCVTSGLSYILVHFLLPLLLPTPLGIPLLLVIVLLSTFLQWGIGKVVKALMSPYACDKIEIKQLSQIKPGSMISYSYFLLPHNAIVTEKQVDSDESEVAIIKCVHYGLKGFTRTVIEDSFELNVKENSKNVKLVDCRHLKTFPPVGVISRVKARIGETKWRLLSNRSDHLCFNALVRDDNDQDSQESCNMGNSKPKLKSSFYVGKKEVHHRSDIKIGHIVKFDNKTDKFSAANGIVVWLEDEDESNRQDFKMDLIVYQNYWAIRKKYPVNLKRERLFIKKYHPSHCCSFDERVQRALRKEGQKCEFWKEKSFLASCIDKRVGNPQT